MADQQRRKVYDAEFSVRRILDLARQGDGTMQVHGSCVTLQRERLFGSLEAVQSYVDGIQELAWYRELWPEAAAHEVRVRRRRGNAKAHHDITDEGESVIAVFTDSARHTWALRELVILHELAHHVVYFSAHARREAHGPEFTGIFLTLIENVLGPEVRMLLAIEYMNLGVRWTETASLRPSAASTT